MADDLTTLQTRRTEAAEALHKLAMGQSVVEVRRGDRVVRYSAINRGDLNTYVASLDAAIAELEIAEAGTLPRRRFIGVSFG